MPPPLPITLHGPVTVLSTDILVTGVLKGAHISILDGSTEVGSIFAVTDAEVLVPLNTSLLVVGHDLSGTQTTSDGKSGVTNYTVRVQAASLSTPILKSAVHTCMTDALVDGLTPGATLVTRVNGVQVGSVEVFPSAYPWYCEMDRQTAIPAGSKLEIVQQMTIGGVVTESASPALPPVPVVPLYLARGSLPAGAVSKNPIQCDTQLSFTNMAPAALTVVTDGNDLNQDWVNPSDTFTGVGSPPLAVGTLDLVQSFPRCQALRPPGDHWSVTVQPLTSLPAPKVGHELCAEILRLTVSGLSPDGVLNLTMVVTPPNAGPNVETPIGSHPFKGVTAVVDLPPDFPWLTPGGLGIAITQSKCGIESPRTTVYRQGGGVLTGNKPPNFANNLYECASAILLDNVFPGANIQAFDSAGNPISEPTQSGGPGLQLLLKVWPSLKTGVVKVVQTGCGVNFSISGTVQSRPNPLPSPTVVGPLRPGTQTVHLKGVLSGATVYVLVDGTMQSTPLQVYDTSNPAVWLFASLRTDQVVSAVQMLCDQTSTPTAGDETPVTLGTLSISGQPASAVRGTTVAFTIVARDSETNVLVSAAVTLNGNSVGFTGQTIHYTSHLGDANPTFVVTAVAGYAPASFGITLTDPVTTWSLTVRAQPIPASIAGTELLMNVDSLSFKIVPEWDPSHAVTVNPHISEPNSTFPTIATSTVTLKIPPANSSAIVNVTLSGLTTLDYPGATQGVINTVSAGYGYAGQKSGLMSWLLEGFSIIDPTTGDGKFGINAQLAGLS